MIPFHSQHSIALSNMYAPEAAAVESCCECEGSGRCPSCHADRNIAVRRRCLDCSGLAICIACRGTGGRLFPLLPNEPQ
jgi:hypothetical protein